MQAENRPKDRRPLVMTLTYNEADNIRPLVERLLNQPVPGLRVLVVDDSSPDGTGAIAESLALEHPGRVIVLHREKKEGYGAAYLAGLRYVADQDLADDIVTIDADLSHDPNDVPRLLAALTGPQDVAIGSRYVPGGGIENWTPERRFASWGANTLARYALGLRHVKDITAGYRAYPAELIRSLDAERLNVSGYGFLTSLLLDLDQMGANFREVPITFVDRVAGESKLGAGDAVAFGTNVARLAHERARREGTYRRLRRFTAVGFVGMLVNMGLLFTLTDMAGWYYLASALLAIEASVLVNFALNERITFPERAAPGKGLSRLARYHGAVTLGLAVNLGMLFGFTHYFGVPYLVSNAIGIGIGYAANFAMSTQYAWAVVPQTPGA